MSARDTDTNTDDELGSPERRSPDMIQQATRVYVYGLAAPTTPTHQEGRSQVQPDIPQYLTPQEVADRYRVSRLTVYRWLSAGLPHERVGRLIRLDPTAVAEWLRQAKSP